VGACGRGVATMKFYVLFFGALVIAGVAGVLFARRDETELAEHMELFRLRVELPAAIERARRAEGRADACDMDRKIKAEEERCRSLYESSAGSARELRADVSRCVEVFKLEQWGLPTDGGSAP